MKVNVSISGAWIIAYLFTIGMADLGGWNLLLALAFWPAYLGHALHIFIVRGAP